MTPPRPGPAITALWVWDNPVDPAIDPRGRAYAPAATDRLVAFARAAGLRAVHLAAPGAPEPGPVDDWLRATVAALQEESIEVSAVADVDTATTPWVDRTAGLAAWDRLQVAVVPWAPVVGGAGDVGRRVLAALDVVRSAGPPLPVDVCVPWWLATEQADDGTPLLDRLADAAERVALAAPGARAEGPDGVLDLARPAVAALAARGRRVTVGVHTVTPELAGGGARTFFDEGPVALLRESALVAAALADLPGFDGVAVDSHRAWRRLLGV